MGKREKDKGVLIFDVLIFSENLFFWSFLSPPKMMCSSGIVLYCCIKNNHSTNVLMTTQ